VLLSLYVVLLALNFFWLKKMIKGALKHLCKKNKADDDKTQSSKDAKKTN